MKRFAPLCLLLVLCASDVFGVTVTELVPRSASRGARVLIAGTGLDAPAITVTFPASDGTRSAASVVTRTATALEVRVPANAAGGEVRVANGTATIAAYAFTVTAPAPFVKSATLVASSPDHAPLKAPAGLFVVPPAGIVYVADSGHHRIQAVLPNGSVQLAADAQFNAPQAVVVDRVRNILYIADTGNNVIRALTPGGTVTTFVAQQAGLKQPAGLAIDAAGNLYVADSGNDKIRRVTPDGVVTTVASGLKEPRGIAVAPDGTLYVADTGNHVIRRIDNGLGVIIAGTGHPGSVDGAAALAELKEPSALAVDESGELLIADSGNHQIRRLANGIVTTVAGSGAPGLADGTDLPRVQYKQPSGIASEGAVYIADTANDAVRMLYRAVALTDVYPRSGNPDGGDVVRLFGSGFVPGQTTVLFGNAPAQATYLSSNELLVTTPPGAAGAVSISVTTPAGTATLQNGFNYVPPFVAVTVSPADATLDPNQSLQLSASGTLAGGGTADLTTRVVWSSSNPSVASVDASGLVHATGLGTATITATFGALTGTAKVTVRDQNAPPPDPATVAPPLDPGASTSTFDSTSFLYTGPNAIQHDVAAGVIEERHVSILRGRVLQASGQPLAGVKVTIAAHPEFGWTRSRVDGYFDITVNGGGTVDVRFEKTGFLPAVRQVSASWQAYATLDDVVLLALDPAATSVTLNAAEAQVTRGSIVSDDDGTRRATMIVPPGTTASMVLPDGSTVPLPSLTVRATEYTVGENGPKAMPASLPPSSGYTYCVELSADEAIAAGATTVQFSRPLSYYVENFIGFPVGTKVPSAYYDAAKRAWIPTPDGRVVRIVSVENALARVDTDGDGLADDSGIDAEERAKLASLYAPGASLWRVSLPHFTPWDFNWATEATGGGIMPSQTPVDFSPQDHCCTLGGSIIEAENQTLGEVLPVRGTPFTLHYQSDRVLGRVAARTLDIRVTEPVMPSTTQRVELEVSVAGRVTRQTFTPAGNQSFRYVWDGRDAYGRAVTGGTPVRVTVSYVYPAQYLVPLAEVGSSFGYPGGLRLNIAARDVIEFSRTWEGTFPAIRNASAERLGGWTLAPHHSYDVASKTLHRGDGTRKSEAGVLFGIPQGVVRTIIGKPGVSGQWTGAGGPAKDALIDNVTSIAVAPDGTLYLSSPAYIHKITPDGTLVRVAGKLPGGSPPDPLKTQPAIDTQLVGIRGIRLGPDGSLYLAEANFGCAACGPHMVRRIRPDGYLTPFAGTGEVGPYVDGLPALSARLSGPADVVAAPDGSVYIADWAYSRILRVGPDGILRSIAGNGNVGFSGDGGPATAATLNQPRAIALGPDGSVYFLEAQRIRRVSPSGIITTVMGTGVCRLFGSTGDGGRATQATMCATSYNVLSVGGDGSIYIGTQDGIRRVNPAGNINTVTGTGPKAEVMTPDGAPVGATNVTIFIGATTVGPDGTLYYSDGNSVVRKVEPSLPSFGASTDLSIVDGPFIHVFDAEGRHLRTIAAETGGTLYRFQYAGGLLASITDFDGNVTAIERNAAGDATAIVAPGGQRTEIAGAPYATSITTAPGETTAFTYTSDGLMKTLMDPRQNTTTFDWNELGLLRLDADPEGGFKSLARTETAAGHLVGVTTAEGRVESYKGETTATEDFSRTLVKSGVSTAVVERRNATSTTTFPDGSTITTRERPDPVWGAQSSFASQVTMALPSGRSSTTTATRTATVADPANPLGSFMRTDTLTTDGRTYTRVFDRAALTETVTSPQLHTITTRFDAASRIRSVTVPSLHPLEFRYDSRGRLESTTQGTRSLTVTYTPKNEVETLQDSLGRVTRFRYDGAGRMTAQTLPDLREISFSYDADGNLLTVTPPARPAHQFDYNKVNLGSRYTPPAVSGGGLTQYAYNRDRQLTSIQLPDGASIDLKYGSAGRLESMTWPTGALTYGYLANGNLASITGAGASLAYTYDSSLLTSMSWSGTVSGKVSWTYDANMQLVSEAVNDSAVAFTYDTDGLLSDVGPLHVYRTEAGIANGTSLGVSADQSTLNAYGETMTYAATHAGAQVLGFEYNRDAAGRITGITEHGPSGDTYVGYAYDPAGRLQDAFYPNVTVHYDYDANGNRTARKVIGSSGTFTETAAYDAQDRLSNYEGAQYAYAPNGELRTKSDVAGTTTYDYDALGNLRGVTLPDGTAIEYVIDGQNRRVGKKVDGSLVAGWLYSDQWQIIGELDGSGKLVSRFVYASRTNVPDSMIRDGVTYRIFSDHLGSPRVVVNTATGAIAAQMQYDESGNVSIDTNPGFIPFGFAGGLYDRQTQLVRFGARDYDPRVGRWTAKDPILFDASGVNVYEYALGDPVNNDDPTGLDTVTADPHVQEMVLKLWKVANWGHRSHEVFAFITQDPQTGRYGCRQLPLSYAANEFKIKKGTVVPSNTIAMIHTHPNDRTSESDDAGDVAAAVAFKKQLGIATLYTISRKGIGKYVAGNPRGTQEETSLSFPNAAADGCGCPK